MRATLINKSAVSGVRAFFSFFLFLHEITKNEKKPAKPRGTPYNTARASLGITCYSK